MKSEGLSAVVGCFCACRQENEGGVPDRHSGGVGSDRDRAKKDPNPKTKSALSRLIEVNLRRQCPRLFSVTRNVAGMQL